MIGIVAAVALADHFSATRRSRVPSHSIRVMYVLPSDATDRKLATNGAIERSVLSFNTWLARQTGGDDLHIDFNPDGHVRIDTYRLPHTDAEIASSHAYVRDRIEEDLRTAGLIDNSKIYAVYYDGSSDFACGGGAWPPSVVGHVAAMYLHGQVPGAPACDSNPVGSSATQPHYSDFAMLHEILHTIGMVPACAPHQTRSGHVSDSPTDLLYAGDQPWYPSVLDIGHDDYYKSGRSDCPELRSSAFFGTGTQLPPGWS